MKLLIDEIKKTCEGYPDSDNIAAYIVGLIDGYELERKKKDQQADENWKNKFDCLSSSLEKEEKYELYAITNTKGDEQKWGIINSHLMTDDDKRNLPRDVWIRHDGRSMPVLDGMKYNIDFGNDEEWSFAKGCKLIHDGGFVWTTAFTWYNSNNKKHITAFKIIDQ